MRVGVDATPLLGARTGIGHYTAHLLKGLSGVSEVDVVAVPFTARGGVRPSDLSGEISWRHRPIPGRALQKAWTYSSLPPVQLMTGRIDLFHGTNFVLPPTGGTPGVVTIHDLSYLRFPELVSQASLAYRALVPRGLKRAGAVLTPTAAIAAEVVDAYRLDPSRVTVTPLGIDPEWAQAKPFSPTELTALGLPSTYLLAVGTLEPRKGLDILIRAYAELISGGVDVPPLVMVGGAGWGPELNTAGLPVGSFFTPGYLAHNVLRRVVAGATVFVFPSRYEGFGIPPLEAMAAGVPVVGSDISTSIEVLGDHAILPPMGDVSALAAAISSSLDSPPDPTARCAAVKHALSWTWQRCVETTVGVYSAVLAG